MCKKVLTKEQIDQYIENAPSMAELNQVEDYDYMEFKKYTSKIKEEENGSK